MDVQISLDTILKNHLIMKEIGKYLSSQDLGNCRITSKDMYGAITPFYRETVVVTNVEEYLKGLEEEGETDLRQIPFRKFHFTGSDLALWKADTVPKFWIQFASVMTYLKLDNITKTTRSDNSRFGKWDEKTFKEAAEFKTHKLTTLMLKNVDTTCQNLLLKLLLNNKTGNVGNLKKLQLQDTTDITDFRNAELIKLVLRYPTIKALTLHNVFDPFNKLEFTKNLESILTSLNEVRIQDIKSFNLKTLDILMGQLVNGSKLSQKTFTLLNELRFPLESLTIDIGISTTVNEVTSFLAQYNGNLKTLELFSGAQSNDIIDQFDFKVRFDALKILRISAFNSLGYLQFMPNLEFLHIYSTMEKGQFQLGGFSSDEDMRRTMTNMTAGTENLKLIFLREFRYDFKIEPEEVSHLSKWMPNLKSLTLVNFGNSTELYNMDLFSGLKELTKLIFLKNTGRCVFFKNVQKMKNLDKLAVLPISVVKLYNDDKSSFDDESSIESDPGSAYDSDYNYYYDSDSDRRRYYYDS